MRFLLAVFFLHVALFGATSNYDKKIYVNQKKLKSKSKVERSIARKLNDIAKDIINEEKKLNRIKKEIEELTKSILINENIVKAKETNLKYLTKQNLNLISKKQKLEEKIVKIIAEDFSFFLISDKDYVDSVDSILIDEAVDKIGVIMQKEISKLSYEYDKINRRIDLQNAQIKDIKNSIDSLKKKKKKLSSLKKSKEISIKELAKKKNEYKKRLFKIAKERESLRATLNKLKILNLK